jgi:hypothetical protein
MTVACAAADLVNQESMMTTKITGARRSSAVATEQWPHPDAALLYFLLSRHRGLDSGMDEIQLLLAERARLIDEQSGDGCLMKANKAVAIALVTFWDEFATVRTRVDKACRSEPEEVPF